MAKLDISEKRLPQDGRIKIRLKIEDRSREMDFRVSSLPTLWGEKIVLRLLDKTKLMLDMTKLGFELDSLDRFQKRDREAVRHRAGHRPHWFGQDQHALLGDRAAQQARHQHHDRRGSGRVQPRPASTRCRSRTQIGLNFATALRSFLRQDPNIILVGEIRDYETAEIAVKAALTGHLVLSTLHTNDAPSTVSRLVNMGIEPFLVGTAINLIQAQRLIRRVCTNCKEEVDGRAREDPDRDRLRARRPPPA